MPDGPFKNLKLGRRWKRFAKASHSDSADPRERCALASDALVCDILTDETQALLTDLQDYARQAQLDLDPLSSVESIFDNHSRTAFDDTLQKELSFRLWDQMTPDAAIRKALEASVDDEISRARNRIQEECIHACESGEMRQDQFDLTVNRANASFDALAKGYICDALRTGDKNAFKNAASKKKGLNEGPSL